MLVVAHEEWRYSAEYRHFFLNAETNTIHLISVYLRARDGFIGMTRPSGKSSGNTSLCSSLICPTS
jgi:hypothetical protein